MNGAFIRISSLWIAHLTGNLAFCTGGSSLVKDAIFSVGNLDTRRKIPRDFAAAGEITILQQSDNADDNVGRRKR